MNDEFHIHVNGMLYSLEKPYQFKAGDIAKGMFGIRLIVHIQGCLWAVDRTGWKICEGQAAFEGNMYVKVGELKDCLPKDE